MYSWFYLTNFDIEVYQSEYELHRCHRHTRASIRTNRRLSLSLRWMQTLTPSSQYVTPFEISNGALRIVWTRYGLDDKAGIFEKRLFERYIISFDSIGASEFVSIKFCHAGVGLNELSSSFVWTWTSVATYERKMASRFLLYKLQLCKVFSSQYI